MKGGETMNYLEDISSLLGTLTLIGFLTEVVVELLKQTILRGKYTQTISYVLSILVALLLCFALDVSLFVADNAFAHILGVVICGLVASRGANYVHNFLGNIPLK
jgi:hypothetical protein